MFRICRDFLPQGNKGEKPSLGKEFAFSVLSVIKEYQNQDWIDFSRIWTMVILGTSLPVSVNHNLSYPSKRMLLWTTRSLDSSLCIASFDLNVWPLWFMPLVFSNLGLTRWFLTLGNTSSDKGFFFYLNLPIFRMLFKK